MGFLRYLYSSKAAGQRKEHWEALRKNNVPRFLFRAWNSLSGGGYPAMINSITEIVPHGFMRGRQGHTFYDMLDDDIYHMAKMHFHMWHEPLSELSSWASSLHLVLCYAKSMPDWKNAHIAVMDRQQLDGNVLIWHAPHLLGKPGKGVHECMAHGCLKGKGVYRSTVAEPCFGYVLRNSMFAEEPVQFTRDDITATKNIAALFGALSLPVKIALLNLRPRYVVDGTAEWHEQVPPMLVKFLNIETLDPHFRDESWLHPGAVYTEGVPGRHFADVRQWITMLRLICQHQPGQTIAEQVKEDVASSVEVRTTEVITTPVEEEGQARSYLRSQRTLEGKKRERKDSEDDFASSDEEPEPGIKRARYDLRSRSSGAEQKDTVEVRGKTPAAGSRTRLVRVAGRRAGLLKVDQYGNVVTRMEYS